MNFEKQAEIFKTLSNPLRLKLLYLLSKKPNISLSDLTKESGVRKPCVSQHLAMLRYLKIVSSKRAGQQTFYSIENKEVKKLLKTFKHT